MTRVTQALERHPWTALAITWPIATLFYVTATHAPGADPLPVAPSAIDALIPFMPGAAAVYATYFLVPIVLIVLGHGRRGFGGVYLGALVTVAACLAMNLAMPSRLIDVPSAPGGSLLALIQRLDTTLAAVPSGHVALPAAAAVGFFRSSVGQDTPRLRWIAALFAMWTVAMAGSALLTKQHYAIDVATGMALGAGVGFAFAEPTHAVHAATRRALFAEWLVIGLAAAVALTWWSPVVVIAAVVTIATRQHALFILYHDGVHGLVARPMRLNDFVINLAVGVPLLIPVHLYRAVHLAHHRDVGTERDPERVLLYHAQPWRYRPLALRALAAQVAGDALGWNNIVMAIRYFRVHRDPNSPLRMAPTRMYPELTALVALAAGVWLAGLFIVPQVALRLTFLWLLPYFTLLQLLQKVRSFAEHAGEGDAETLTYSWSPGVLGRLTIWPYNINYHFEHHARPAVPWNELPAVTPSQRRKPGRDLVPLLWSGAGRRPRATPTTG